jgi:pyruvate dehydrogenase complex dehydrogenase (E1) component
MKFSCTVTMPDGQKVKHDIDIPEINTDNLEAMVEYFGRDVVTQAAKGNIHVQMGRVARALFEDGKSLEEVLATLRTYKPGAKVRVSGGRRKTRKMSVSELEDLRQKLGLNLSDEEMAAVAAEFGISIVEE